MMKFIIISALLGMALSGNYSLKNFYDRLNPEKL
jgi:hypothetical protein